MKSIKLKILSFIVFVLLGEQNLQVLFADDFQEVKTDFPSLTSGGKNPIWIDGVFSSYGDYRELFALQKVLEDREHRSVCVFDWNRTKGVRAAEISVQPDTLVKDLLGKVGLKDWNGYQSIVLITKTRIQMSPSPLAKKSADSITFKEFLETPVPPGAFLVICPTS